MAGLAAGAVLAQPVVQTWPAAGADDTVAVAAAALSGWYATADSFEDSVEIRDIDQNLVRTITRAQITALLPWMSLDGGPDGPSGLAWSDSGRLLFVLVHDANPATDGQPSDAVLRYDLGMNSLSVFARLELSIATTSGLISLRFTSRAGSMSGVTDLAGRGWCACIRRRPIPQRESC